MIDWQLEWPAERIADVSGVDDARYVAPEQDVRLATLAGSERLNPRTIIEVGGQYLVETVDEPGVWSMGERATDGAIVCWGTYGDLESALRGL